MGMVAFNGLTQNTSYGEGNDAAAQRHDRHRRACAGVARKYVRAHGPVRARRHLRSHQRADRSSRAFSRIPTKRRRSIASRCAWRAMPERRIASIQNAWSEVSEAAPGERRDVKVLLRPYRGAPMIATCRSPFRRRPRAAARLRVQVSDSDSLNRMVEYLGGGARTPGRPRPAHHPAESRTAQQPACT